MGEVEFQEQWIEPYSGKDVYGLWTPDGVITINPIPHIVDTIIHELLHEAYPDWSERAVYSMTGKLMKQLTSEEMQTIYEEYRRKVEND